jgi:polar amino acid transport system permease protein
MGYQFDWGVILEYRAYLTAGLVETIELSIACLALSIVIGTFVGTVRHFAPSLFAWPFVAFVEFFRNVPAIVQLFFWYYAIGLDIFPAALIGLSLFSGAYFSEAIRSGYRSIPKTQIEAARASGMTFLQMIQHVILPQSLLRVIPALSVECISVVKNSSLAMTIGLAELTFQAQEINALTFRGFEAATAVTVLYVAIVFTVIGATHLVERALRADLKS